MAGKPNTESSKKSELLKELKLQDIKIKNLEKERGMHIFNRRSDFRKDFTPLEEMDMRAFEERKHELIKIKLHLNKIRNNVSKFHRELKDVKPTPEFVEKLKIIMEEIEQNICQFKEQQRLRYEELMIDERTTSLEIAALEKRIEMWTLLPAAAIDPVKTGWPKPPTSARDVIKDLPPDVAAFEKFLSQTGGHQGGWDEYDHQTFLRLRLKYKGKPVFLKELISLLPTQTEQAIEEHEIWYQDYLELNERKKSSIQHWKKLKEAEKVDELHTAERQQEADELAEKQKTKTMLKRIEMEKEERFSKLSAWKVQKELEKAEREEKRLRADLEKSKHCEKDQEKQIRLKAQVEEYKRQKNDEDELHQLHEQMRKEEEELERKRQLAVVGAKIRERNDHLVEEKIARLRSKKAEEEEKQKRLERSRKKIDVPRDPSRLFKLTEGWKERRKDSSQTSNGQVYQIPHRAVPSWRQGPQ